MPADVAAPKRFCSPNIVATAIPPRPIAQRLKKCRRVSSPRCCAGSNGENWWDMELKGACDSRSYERERVDDLHSLTLVATLRIRISFTGDRFIEIQQHAGDRRPRFLRARGGLLVGASPQLLEEVRE